MQATGAHLLVIDDDPQIRSLLTAILSQAGHRVRSAPDGLSALAELDRCLPRLILSDLNMPRMSGFEFLSVVRRRFPSIPVIAVSASFTGPEVPPGLPADAFYEKASGIALLLQLVAEHTSSPTPRPPSRPQVPIWVEGIQSFISLTTYALLTCPSCLRTYPHVFAPEASVAQQALCIHCRTPTEYAIVPPLGSAPLTQ